MDEWLLVRVAMLGILVGGGVLLALAGNAFDRWRERRACASSARQNEVLAAEYRVNPTQIERWREGPVRGVRGSGVAAANHRANLTHITALRSPAQ
jgi:hypothetical protein